MRFRTEIKPQVQDPRIDHTSAIGLLGSCFTDEIGNRLNDEMFEVSVNPFGPLFNPDSIAKTLEDVLKSKKYTNNDLFEYGGRFRTFDRHSDFSDVDSSKLLVHLNKTIADFEKFLDTCNVLIITFGSAIAFKEISSDQTVTNCHKLPASNFIRYEILENTIIERWTALINKIRETRPSIKFIFTVSPVRHIGYGLVADRLSKSRLIIACHELSKLDGVTYFPSYELLVDDLRDYRFYTDDLIHPSSMAVTYIYNVFRQSFMDDKTIELADRWYKLTRRCQHLFKAESYEKELFQKETLRLAENFSNSFKNKDQIIQRFKLYYSQCL